MIRKYGIDVLSYKWRSITRLNGVENWEFETEIWYSKDSIGIILKCLFSKIRKKVKINHDSIANSYNYSK